MVQSAAAAPPEPVKGADKVTIKLYFRHFAWAYAASFFGTLIVSGIVTFLASPYSPETDKITLFYGMFNPCIWFDHYPAKIFATSGMGIFLCVGIAYSAMVYLYVYSEKRVLKVMWGSAVIGFVTLIDLVFVNVFTTNLYPLEDDDVRRLHGVHFGANSTVSLVEEKELTHADISTIKLHTLFYILWVAGQLLLSIYMFKRAWDSSGIWSSGAKAKVIGLFILGWYGMAMHAAAMMVIILHPEPKVDWYFKEDLCSIIQHAIIYVDAKTFTSAWGWLPIMLYRLVLPTGRGISLTFRLEKTATNDDGAVMPEQWMTRCFLAIAGTLACGGVFDQEWTTEATASKLMYSMRSKPYAYFGAPAFLSCLVMLFFGLGLQVIQRHLISGQMPWKFAAHAGLFFLLMFFVLLVILEKANFVEGVAWFLQVVFLGWVLHMNQEEILAGRWIKPVAYCLAGIVMLVILAATDCFLWSFYFVYCIWISLYGTAVPDGPWLYITAERLDEEGSAASYQEVPHNTAVPAVP